MKERLRLADFWDEVLDEWEPGAAPRQEPLAEWMASYQGKGKGAVDLDHYPDPYIGDLRGLRSEPRLVLLGINPGIGYDQLQGPDGIWTKRIKEQGYSRCFSRSPGEDEETWRQLHAGPSRYWANLVRFAGRWLDDPSADVSDILNFELYPWHSFSVSGAMKPPAQIVDDFVWKPIQEVEVDQVFAFGAAWVSICEQLGLEKIAMYGKGGDPWPTDGLDAWHLGVYELASGQRAVVSHQSGYAGPPGLERLSLMRKLLEGV